MQCHFQTPHNKRIPKPVPLNKSNKLIISRLKQKEIRLKRLSRRTKRKTILKRRKNNSQKNNRLSSKCGDRFSLQLVDS
jgi:hypothetical protein